MKVAKTVGKIGVVAAAAVAAVTMWNGGIAHADTPFFELQPVSGQGAFFPWESPDCVALNAAEGFYNNHTQVFEWTCNGHPDQEWSLHFYANAPDGSALYQIINKQSGKCMEVADDNLFNGTAVDQFTCGAGSIDSIATQLWEAPALSAELVPWSTMRQGWWFCLDVRGGNTDNGTVIEQWSCNGTDAQHFAQVAP